MPGASLPPKDDETALAAHKKLRARIEHLPARMKDRQMFRQRRHRGNTINHAVPAVAYLWNLRLTHVRVNS